MKFFVAFALCVVAVSASPLGMSSDILAESAPVVEDSATDVPVAETTTTTTQIPILKQQLLIENGSFINNFETGQGIVVDESGSQKQIGEGSGTVSSGSFSFTNPDGTVMTVTWIANENGFQASGDHLPTPPPMPDHVVKMLADMEAALDAISIVPQTPSEAAPAPAVEDSSVASTDAPDAPAPAVEDSPVASTDAPDAPAPAVEDSPVASTDAPHAPAPAVEDSSVASTDAPVETVPVEAVV